MNKTQPLIHISELNKIYRLYHKPHYRFLDMLGLLSKNKPSYDEHYALNNINLTINKGEKIAIVGRNGAGKSTLLKIISGVLTASSGQIKVRARARALLQIGTGFHPEFTGRENAQAYFAQLGVRGDACEALIEGVIEFAELEEYIDQPVKMYSTGMVARLMFATSTAIAPELLILDEVLSVGDAYFSQKSLERITNLCSSQNSTMLLVTHDSYAAAKLADRIIWIDNGEVICDGPAKSTLKAYEDSIRQQEETRLRKCELNAISKMNTLKQNMHLLLLEIQTKNNNPLEDLVYFAAIDIRLPDGRLISLPICENANAEAGLILHNACWGEPTEMNEKPCRALLNYGSPYHKIAGFFNVENLDELIGSDNCQIDIQCFSSSPCELVLKCFQLDKTICQYSFMPEQLAKWHQLSFPLERLPTAASDISHLVYGTGDILVKSVRLFDSELHECALFSYGDELLLKVFYQINNPSLNEQADIIIAVMKNGVETACRFFTRALTFCTHTAKEGCFTLQLPELAIGIGEYTITVLIAKNGYVDKTNHRFYTINPDMYCCVRDIAQLKVIGGNVVSNGTPYVGTGYWQIGEVDQKEKENTHVKEMA